MNNNKSIFVYTFWYTNKEINNTMSIIEVSSREFREKQKAYLDLVDKGAQVILKRGKKQAYMLTPISEDDLYLTPNVKKRLDKSIQQMKEGKVVKLNTKEELEKYLDNL